MKQLNTNIKAVLPNIKTSIYKIAWAFILLTASIKLHAQIDIAGEMDLTKKTFNQSENPASADLFNDADFKLYPNPAQNVINIQSKVKLKEGVTLTLYDISGTILEKKVLESSMTKKDYAFNISKFTDGQYIIGIRSIDGSYVTKKLIKR
ncbi:MAG: T9SS type A sorting domain-containing protein [Mariniphaga sp.]|nr:T9SS type A sorting domain-containing protein [Mariniphaga sp.]